MHIRRLSKLVRLTINAQIVFLLFGSSRKNVPAARSESADDHEGLLLKLDKRGVLLRADVLPLQVHFLKLRRAREPRSANLSGARSRMKRRTGYRLWMKRDVEKKCYFLALSSLLDSWVLTWLVEIFSDRLGNLFFAYVGRQ